MNLNVSEGHRNIVQRGISALERARDWLSSMVWHDAPDEYRGISRTSDWHDPMSWPGMLLPATYNATIAQVLIGGYDAIGDPTRRCIGTFLGEHQERDGRFFLSGMEDTSMYKGPDRTVTRNYIALHLTNYARQALSWTAPEALLRPRFVESIIPIHEFSAETCKRWLAHRDWNDPWMEGNVIVNIGGILLDRSEEHLVDLMINELNAIQNPNTGFWGNGQSSTRRALLHAFAGGMHSFHLYYYRGMPIPNAAQALDVALDLATHELKGVTSACLDVDLVDMLAAFWPDNYRRREIRAVIAQKVDDLIRSQNDDGGFYDEPNGIRRFDGWVGGYWEPQGLSNCFATWFRSLAIAIGLSVLDPHTIERWTFRDRIGIGYFDPNRLQEI